MTDHNSAVMMTVAQVGALHSLITHDVRRLPAVHISQGYTKTRVPSYIHVSIGGRILGIQYQISRTGIITRL